LPAAVRALLAAIERDVCDARLEWSSEIRLQVVDALTRAVRAGGYKEGTLPYLKRLVEVSVEGYVLHRLNKMVEEGADMSALVHAEDAGALFSACVCGVLACKESTWRCSALQREMVCTLAALARAGTRVARELGLRRPLEPWCQGIYLFIYYFLCRARVARELVCKGCESCTGAGLDFDGDTALRRDNSVRSRKGWGAQDRGGVGAWRLV
jgi:hypothetical protein